MFNKLFSKILDSSVWLEPATTRIVWITLLAAMDEDGYAHFSAIENLASRARVTMDECKSAVDCFLSPDTNSSNPENDGRRVERVPGGFFILNAARHREIMNRVVQREQTRVRVQRYRNQEGLPLLDVAQKPTIPPAREDLNLHAAKIGLPTTEVDKFVFHYESNGWMVGKNKMRSWVSAMSGWKTRWEESGRAPGGATDLFALGKELDRLNKMIPELRRTYGDHQSWTDEDRKKLTDMQARRKELMAILKVKY